MCIRDRAKGAHSSIYLSILDADGDMLVGMSDMRIVQQDLPADYLPSQKQLDVYKRQVVAGMAPSARTISSTLCANSTFCG